MRRATGGEGDAATYEVAFKKGDKEKGKVRGALRRKAPLESGGDGDDNINSGGDDDTIVGGDGNDTLFGGSGADVVLGEDGDDRVFGQGGVSDTLSGGEGNDVLVGLAGEIDEAFTVDASVRALLDSV